MAKQYNRRLDRRIPIEKEAVIRLADGTEIPAECMELSVSGMRLLTSHGAQIGDELEVQMNTPDRESKHRPPLHVILKVLRCNPEEGAQFDIGGEIIKVLK